MSDESDNDDHPQLQDIDSLESQFKQWITGAGGTQSTADTYWTRIRGFPFFRLQDTGTKELVGKIDKAVDKREELTAIRQFLEFLYEEYEEDEVTDEEYAELKFKKNSVANNISIPKKERKRNDDSVTVDAIKRHHLHADDLIRLLHTASPGRATLYYILYVGGFRIGELLRHGPKHLRPDYGDHGAIKIQKERSKSKQGRTVAFLSDTPVQVLEEAPVGDWEDDKGNVWEDVFFPTHYAQLENYYLRKYCKRIGLDRRTPHSFRHTRITHLIHSSELAKDKVQRRSGHASSQTTDYYTETVFDREPMTLEQYCTDQEIDVVDVLAASEQ